MHRIGGIEKEDGTGNISYDPDNHERMVHLRAAKVAGIADDIPDAVVEGDVDDAELLVVGWGSTWGAIDGAVDRVPGQGPQGRPRPPHPPQPVPAEPRRGAAPLPEGAGARDEPRPAVAGCCGPSSWSTPSRSPRSGACPSPPASSKPAILDDPRRTADDRRRLIPVDHPQGLVERPGGPLVPGLRRLLDPRRRAAAHARPRACAARTPCSCPASAAPPGSRTT